MTEKESRPKARIARRRSGGMTQAAKEQVYREIFERGPDGIIGVYGDGRIAIVNHEAAEMFGYPRGELLGMVIEDLLPETHRQDHRKYREQFVRYPYPRRMGTYLELFGQRKNGEIFPVDVMLCPLRVGPDLVIVSIVRDMVSRLKETHDREQLRRSLDEALSRVERLHGLLPICAWCKKIRDDHGYWSRLEEYFHEHSHLDFTHGICPDCAAAFSEKRRKKTRRGAPLSGRYESVVSGGSRLTSIRFG